MVCNADCTTNDACRGCMFEKTCPWAQIGIVVVLILAIALGIRGFVAWKNSRPINEKEMEQLEDWVVKEYPISEDITAAYKSDNKISYTEYLNISKKVRVCGIQKEKDQLQERARKLAGE